ncbi:MAG: hypothetical protein ACM31C_23985 [Acidobacteriota bacterium]
MTHFRSLYTTIFLGVALIGCAVSSSATGGGGGGGGDTGSGSGSGSDTGSGSGSGSDNTQPTYPTAHPRIYLGPNKARLQQALSSGTTAAVRFKSIVDQWVGGTSLWGFETWNAALLGQLTGDPKYCAKAIATVDQQVSDAEASIASGVKPAIASDSYLDVGPMLADLTLTYDWCFDTVTAAQKTRWLAYANQAVWNVWNNNQAQWGGQSMPWSGWAVNDPSDNYYYSFLQATMLLGLAEMGDDPAGDTWITQFRQTKMLDQLVPTFDSDLVGGGSREGTGYGTAMMRLFWLYDFWYATTGEKLAVKTPHTRASMLAMMHQIVPTLDRFAPTGDQSRDSTASMFDYQRNYLQELVHLFATDSLAPRVATLLADCSVPVMGSQFMAVDDFLYDNADVSVGSMAGGTAYYAPGIGELYARSGWDTHATWMNLIAGPYTEGHAHQDQGSLLVYKDGWLAYDAVVDSHSGLRQEPDAHGLVRVTQNGSTVGQQIGNASQMVALHSGTGWLYAAADITPMYTGSAVSRMQREIVYLQPDTIVVYDRVTSASGTQQVWSLATPKQPSISGSTATITGTHALHVQRLAPASATSSVFNYATQDPSGDYSGGFRLDETAAGGDQRFLHVLSIDGAVASASAANDSTVTVTLANQQTATITFNHDSVGATLTFGGATTSLGAGVDALPE